MAGPLHLLYITDYFTKKIKKANYSKTSDRQWKFLTSKLLFFRKKMIMYIVLGGIVQCTFSEEGEGMDVGLTRQAVVIN